MFFPSHPKDKKMHRNYTPYVSLNINALGSLMDDGLAADLKEFGLDNSEMFGTNKEVAEAMAELKTERRKALVKEAASSMMLAMEEANQYLKDEVIALRDARAKEMQLKANIAKVNRAKQYALETNNYFPLLWLTSDSARTVLMESGNAMSKVHVPVDWQPAASAAQTAEAFVSKVAVAKGPMNVSSLVAGKKRTFVKQPK